MRFVNIFDSYSDVP